MEMMLQPNAWSCMPAAFAMALGQTPKEIIYAVGHDGSEVIFPLEQEPMNRRGFQLQELIDVCLQLDVVPVVIHAYPRIVSSTGVLHPVFDDETANIRMDNYLNGKIGVLLGQSDGHPHAVAWNGYKIFDPKGVKYEIQEFGLQTFILFL